MKTPDQEPQPDQDLTNMARFGTIQPTNAIEKPEEPALPEEEHELTPEEQELEELLHDPNGYHVVGELEGGRRLDQAVIRARRIPVPYGMQALHGISPKVRYEIEFLARGLELEGSDVISRHLARVVDGTVILIDYAGELEGSKITLLDSEHDVTVRTDSKGKILVTHSDLLPSDVEAGDAGAGDRDEVVSLPLSPDAVSAESDGTPDAPEIVDPRDLPGDMLGLSPGDELFDKRWRDYTRTKPADGDGPEGPDEKPRPGIKK